MVSRLRNTFSSGKRHSIFSIQRLLNEDHLNRTAEKFSNMKSIKTQPQKPTKNAAVLIPLCVVDGQLALLYTLRAENLKTHRGQVSFPGGMEDADDANPQGTALRETEEELGIKQDLISVWGTGNVVMSKGRTNVLPVIGVINSPNVIRDLNLNPNEVKEAFAVPIEVLCDPKMIRHTQFRTNYSLPVYVGGKRKIWGLTAIITHLFLKAFLPKEAYDHNVKYIQPLKSSIPYRYM